MLPRNECGMVLLTLICRNSFGIKIFFTGTVPLIDLDAGLSSRFLSAHPEELGDLSHVVGKKIMDLATPDLPCPSPSPVSPGCTSQDQYNVLALKH